MRKHRATALATALAAAAALGGAAAGSTTTAQAATTTPRAVAATTVGSGHLAPRPPRRAPSLVRVSAADLGQIARRTFDSQILYPCNKHVMTWIDDRLHLLADFGGGEQMDEIEVVRTLRAAGFTWAEMPDAIVVTSGESMFCPRAVRNNLDQLTGAVRSTDVGLWQINVFYHPQYATWNLKDPLTASKAAKQIKDRYGWKPWHAYANRDSAIGWATDVVARAKAAGVR